MLETILLQNQSPGGGQQLLPDFDGWYVGGILFFYFQTPAEKTKRPKEFYNRYKER